MHLTVQGLKEKRDVNGLIAALNDKNYVIRKEAALALGELQDPHAIKPLVSALQYRGLSADTDLPVRVAAATALGKLGDPQAIKPLVAVLQGRKFAAGDVPVRSAVVTALGDLADPLVVEPLITAFKDAPIRDSVVVSFGKLGNYALEPLLKALNDKDKAVRMSAAAALGELGNPQGVEPLIAALGDNQSSVRSAAAAALGKLGDLRAVEPLLAIFQDKDNPVRSSVANALGNLGDSRAVGPLTAALQDKDAAVRTIVAAALKKFVDSQPVKAPTPTHPAHEETAPGSRIMTPAEMLGGSQAVESFITILQDQGISNSMRASAAATLGELGDSQAVEPLIAALKDKDASIRATVVTALTKLGDPRAVEPLVLTLWDSHSSVRKLAANALEKLSDPRTVELLVMKVRDKYSCGQIPVKSVMVKTGVYRPPAIPEYCVGCGGPPPLVAEAFGKEVDITISLGGKRATHTQAGYQNFMTQKYPLHFYLCEHCASRERVMKPLKKRVKIIGYSVSALVILLSYVPVFYIISSSNVQETIRPVIDQLRSISEWIGIGVGFLLAGLLIISPFIFGAIAYNLMHKFLVSKKRPDYIGPQFESDLVSFSKNTKSGVGGQSSFSDELTYTFACDSYGEKFREMNSEIVKTAWYEESV